ncbi:MAG: LysE family translocator [Desulfobacterales bacterium]|nr:LysE family translocator [Desulfobacterales bacterium]
MIELLTIFFTSFLVALSGAMMPGPLLSVTISESSHRGYITGPLLIVGHGILELALIISLLLGLAPFLQRKEVFFITAIGGSIVLLWMAFGMFRSPPFLTLKGRFEKSSNNNLLITGVLLSIVNPYWTIWWVSIGLGYILHSLSFGKWGVFSFFSGHIMADLLWYSAISAAVWRGKEFLSDRSYRILIGVCAIFLIIFSFLFAYSGIKKVVI